MIDLNRDNFKAYLEQHKRDRFLRRDPCRCPIAKWVDSQLTTPHGLVKAYMSGVAVYKFGDLVRLDAAPLPPWAREFMERLDVEQLTSADGATCLAVLDTVGAL